MERKILIALLIFSLLLSALGTTFKIESYSQGFIGAENEELKRILYYEYKKGPVKSNYEYEVTNDWVSIIENHPYYAYNQPHLSWKVAEVLDGLNYAYRATGDKFFLDEVLVLYEALLAKRDDAVQRCSWDGKVYHLWGSTSRYNGARKSIYNSEGIEVASLNFHGVHNDQITISLESDDNYFDLIIKNKNKEYVLKNLTLRTLSERIEKEIDLEYYGSMLKGNKVIKASVDQNYLDSIPVGIKETMPDNIVLPNVVHTGLILDNMVLTYNELKRINHHETAKYKSEIELMIRELIEATWIEVNDKEGYFTAPKNSPTYLGGGKILPWNQQFPLVSAMAIFSKEENDEEFNKIVKQFSNYFLKNIQKTKDGYLWRYWEEETGTIDWYESVNYGGIDVENIYKIYQTGIAFNKEDIKMISKIIANRIIKSDGKISSRIDGSGNGNIISLFRYLPYAYDVPEIRNLLVDNDLNWMQAARLLYYK